MTRGTRDHLRLCGQAVEVGDSLPKFGSLGHPLSLTPLGPVSIRKCLTSSWVMSPGMKREEDRALFVAPSLHLPMALRHFSPLRLWEGSKAGMGSTAGAPEWRDHHSGKYNHRVPIILLPCALTPAITRPRTCPPEESDSAGTGPCCSWGPQAPQDMGLTTMLSRSPVRGGGATFFILLHDGRRGRRHLHGQPIGPSEGVAVADDEGPWLLVLEECDGWDGKEMRREGGRGQRWP